MTGEQRLGALALFLLCLAILGFMGACSYHEEGKRNHESEIVRTCLESGGEWVQQQIDGDYGPEKVCSRGTVDNDR